MTYYKLYEEAICKLDRCEITLDEFDEMIKPLHDEVRPTGHWIKKTEHKSMLSGIRFYCSECGKWQTYGETAYCCKCGAKMEVSG